MRTSLSLSLSGLSMSKWKGAFVESLNHANNNTFLIVRCRQKDAIANQT
jgi:hypothetical protein